MSDYIPRDVLFKIFAKLPVKSLLRFRCVSKNWLSLITDPDFRAKYLKESKNNQLLIKYYDLQLKQERYLLRFDEDGVEAQLNECLELKCPFKTRTNTFFRMVGVVKGLICLSDDQFDYAERVILWNPAIRKCVNLPKPLVCLAHFGPYMFALGFGVSGTNDFKVVRIAYQQCSRENHFGRVFMGNEGYDATPMVDVFSLRTGCWKSIAPEMVPPFRMVEYFWSSVFVNGKIHWLVYRNSSDKDRKENIRSNTILGFDVGGEFFCELKLPNMLVLENPLNLVIALSNLSGDTLSVFHYDNRNKIGNCSVWVMQKYGVMSSWSNLFNVNLEGGLGAALGFRRNGDILLAKKSGRVVSYDPHDGAVTNFSNRGGRDSVYVGTYAESFALLDGVNAQVDSCVMADDSEEQPDSNAPDARTLKKHAFMHFLFASTSLNS